MPTWLVVFLAIYVPGMIHYLWTENWQEVRDHMADDYPAIEVFTVMFMTFFWWISLGDDIQLYMRRRKQINSYQKQ